MLSENHNALRKDLAQGLMFFLQQLSMFALLTLLNVGDFNIYQCWQFNIFEC